LNTHTNERNRRLARHLAGLGLAFLFFGGLARATDPLPQSTIDELLRLDSQAALVAARKNIFGVVAAPDAGHDPALSAAQSNQVLAIYGLGKTLTAEVLLESEPHVFKSSRAKPVWGHLQQYTLERIAPPCVYLKKIEQSEILCLSKGQ